MMHLWDFFFFPLNFLSIVESGSFCIFFVASCPVKEDCTELVFSVIRGVFVARICFCETFQLKAWLEGEEKGLVIFQQNRIGVLGISLLGLQAWANSLAGAKEREMLPVKASDGNQDINVNINEIKRPSPWSKKLSTVSFILLLISHSLFMIRWYLWVLIFFFLFQILALFSQILRLTCWNYSDRVSV